MSDMAEDRRTDCENGDLRALFHRLTNQLSVILAHAELLEAKSPDDAHRTRASQVVDSTLEALSVTHALRDRINT